MKTSNTTALKYPRAIDIVIQLVTIIHMRQVINISLPLELKREVEKAVKQEKYATKSEFFRDLLRLWKIKKHIQLEERRDIFPFEIAVKSGVFDFYQDEQDIYSQSDIKEYV